MTEFTMKEKLNGVIKNRIAGLCEENELSYYGLSYKSSLPQSTLLHIVDGTSKNPGVYTIMKICDGLGITMKEFFDTPEFEEILIDSRDER